MAQKTNRPTISGNEINEEIEKEIKKQLPDNLITAYYNLRYIVRLKGLFGLPALQITSCNLPSRLAIAIQFCSLQN